VTLQVRLLPVLLVALLASTARAQDSAGRLAIPKNEGWVTDKAGLLSAGERRELEKLMESYKQGTTHEIALLTVESLQGEPIEKFALEVGRAWSIGGKEKNNGALLVVSKTDRKIRIEVGRGLEGNLTDSISGRIIRDVMVPKFKQGRYAEGIEGGIVAIHQAIGGKYGELPGGGGGGAAFAGLLPLLIFLIIIIIFFARVARRARGGRGGGFFLGPWIGGGFGGGGGGGGGGFSGGGFSGFGGGGGFSGGGASGGW
jgi:uncharacterized protein